ncbi:MAG: hydroxyethylthiazole kinase [Rhodanobacteraceae bacterium]
MTTNIGSMELAAICGMADALREHHPLVQCITNVVTVNFVANVLLAVGATPAMVDIPDEAGAFARVASGLLINLGTPHVEQRTAMLEAAAAAHANGTPWVLDPVAVGSLPVRTQLAHALLDYCPTIIRGNASEIIALAGAGQGGRGVDSNDDPAQAVDAARRLAVTTGGAVAVSGPTDIIVDAQQTLRMHNGHAYLTRITGGGCALGAVMAACAGLHPSPLLAAAGATALYTIAAEQAAVDVRGPGSFAVALLDRLSNIIPDEVARAIVLESS